MSEDEIFTTKGFELAVTPEIHLTLREVDGYIVTDEFGIEVYAGAYVNQSVASNVCGQCVAGMTKQLGCNQDDVMILSRIDMREAQTKFALKVLKTKCLNLIRSLTASPSESPAVLSLPSLSQSRQSFAPVEFVDQLPAHLQDTLSEHSASPVASESSSRTADHSRRKSLKSPDVEVQCRSVRKPKDPAR